MNRETLLYHFQGMHWDVAKAVENHRTNAVFICSLAKRKGGKELRNIVQRMLLDDGINLYGYGFNEDCDDALLPTDSNHDARYARYSQEGNKRRLKWLEGKVELLKGE